ncbi:hypothetical protein M1446_04330 [Candidatus Dependentiae bacterium]|nr:hypothetical protein [Candidatus Dependentiae bacterium]
MFRYIFSLLFLLISTNLFCMESGESKIKREKLNSSDFFSLLKDEEIAHIFKFVAKPNNVFNPTNPLDPKEIKKSNQYIKDLKQTCKRFNKIIKSDMMQNYAEELYKIKAVQALNNDDKKTHPHISTLETAIKHDIVPYVAYQLGKKGEQRHWLQVLNIAHQYNKDFISAFKFDIPFYSQPLHKQKSEIREKIKNTSHSELMGWLIKNRIDQKICGEPFNLCGTEQSRPILYSELHDFTIALEQLHKH